MIHRAGFRVGFGPGKRVITIADPRRQKLKTSNLCDDLPWRSGRPMADYQADRVRKTVEFVQVRSWADLHVPRSTAPKFLGSDRWSRELNRSKNAQDFKCPGLSSLVSTLPS